VNLAVVYRDEALIVIDKPSGLLAVPGKGDDLRDSVAARVQAAWPQARVVHRLDLATSGLMLMALDAESHRRMNRQFRERDVDKRYVAAVAGCVDEDSGEIDLPLIVDWPNRPLQKVDHALGKPSLTRWRVLAREPGRTRLELSPVTGRSHQLRVHLQAIGHPILGDTLYGGESVRQAAPRLLLHASELRVVHPLRGDALHFKSEPPF
jgi:tRNA pseudouridine32 synthase / 23S rRNA pseudouridine746 synthase